MDKQGIAIFIPHFCKYPVAFVSRNYFLCRTSGIPKKSIHLSEFRIFQSSLSLNADDQSIDSHTVRPNMSQISLVVNFIYLISYCCNTQFNVQLTLTDDEFHILFISDKRKANQFVC